MIFIANFAIKIPVMSAITNQPNICAICAETVTKTGKLREITCSHCDQSACRTCCETFMLDETSQRCMYPNCGKVWSRKFLSDNFTTTFITGPLKKHREEIYFDREKALLPATQEHVAEAIHREAVRDIGIKWVKRKLEAKQPFIDRLSAVKTEITTRLLSGGSIVPTTDKAWKKLPEYINRLKLIKKEMNSILQLMRVEESSDWNAVRRKKVTTERRFIRACTSGACKGFLSSAWKCGLCNQHACSKCHVVIGTEIDVDHECDPDTLATAKLISSEAKPCPGCHINISKIDGCNQMWCTMCNTAWDWKTGNIETKVHNPHYFEYLRTLKPGRLVDRNPNEVRCGREINFEFVTALLFIMQRLEMTLDEQLRVTKTIQTLEHFVRYAIRDIGESPSNQYLRVNYMRNIINASAFKTGVQRNYKKFDKEREINEVCVMLKQSMIDILYRYRDELDHSVDADEARTFKTLDEIKHLVEYGNDCLRTIATTYQSKPIVVMKSLRF